MNIAKFRFAKYLLQFNNGISRVSGTFFPVVHILHCDTYKSIYQISIFDIHVFLSPADGIGRGI
jgi:hypothetical protein